MKIINLTLLVCLVFAGSAFGAGPFYVDVDAADDTGTGAIGDPWKTWNKAMTTVAAGEIVYFQEGDTWTEAYTNPTATPTEEIERITIGSYGSGDRPVLKQPDAQNTSAFILTNKSFITFDGIAFDANGAGQSTSSRAFSTGGTSGNIIWTDCEFYNATVNSVSAHGVLIASGTTFLMDSCVFHDNISFGVITTQAGTTIQDSTFTNNGKAIGLTTAGSFTAQRNTIIGWAWGTQPDGGIVVNTPGDGIYVGYNTASGPLAEYDCYRITITGGAQTDVQIVNNYVDGGLSSDYGLFVNGDGATGGIVSGNTVIGIKNSGICLFGTDAWVVSKNKVTTTGLGVSGTHDAGINLYGDVGGYGISTGNIITNNILDGNQIGIQLWGETAATDMDANLVYNNTIINSVAQNIYLKDYGQNQVVTNNISDTPGTDHVEVEANSQTSLTMVTNDYYPEGNDMWTWGATTDIDTLVAWRTASSEDANSIITDPHLNAFYRSPLAAIYAGGTDLGYTEDYYGNAQSFPWIGAVGWLWRTEGGQFTGIDFNN